MVTPPGNTPQGSSPSQIQGKDQLEALKAVLKIQGDYNNLLKESVRDLDQTLRRYDKMEAKLASINRSAINTKEIERQMKTVAEEQYLNKKKLADLANELSKDQINDTLKYLSMFSEVSTAEKDLLKAQKAGNIQKVKDLELSIENTKRQLDEQEALLNIEQLSYAQAVKTDELNKETLAKQQAQLDFENKLTKQVGFTGAAFKFLAEKIGVGESYMEDMVERARKLNEEGKKFTFGDKLSLLIKAGKGALKEAFFKDPVAFAAAMKGISMALGKIGDGFGKAGSGAASMSEHSSSAIRDLTGGVTNLIKQIPVVGGLIGGMLDGFAGLLDFAVGATSHIHGMGRQIGLSKDESVALNNEFSRFAIHAGDATINSEKLFKTHLAMTKQMGINNKLSNENLETAHKLADFAGMDETAIAGMATVSKITGKSIANIGGVVQGQLGAMKKATGIAFPFQQTMKELTSLSGVLGLQFAKYPGKMTNTYLTTKALGLELNKVNSIADGFLDFESSISKEFETQLLTGKNINGQKIRELALNNDLAGVASEISKTVGNSNEFLKMNRIQQESIASYAGMSRDEFADMLKQQELLSKFGAKDTKDLQEKVKLLQEQGRSQEAINKLGSEEAFNKYLTANASENLSGFIDKIKQTLSDLVSNTGLADFIDRTIKFLAEPENIMGIIKRVQGVFATIVDVMGTVIGGIMSFLNIFPGIDIPPEMIEMVKGAGGQIRNASLGDFGGGGGIGNKAASSTVAASSGAVKPQGFAKPENMMAKTDNTTVVHVNMTDSVTTTKVVRNNEIDKSNLYNQGT
jgi:AraC-like DNA-binding protein